MRSILMLIPGSMITWKLFFLQRRLVYEHAPELLAYKKDADTLDIEGMALVSYSEKKEGSEFGHSKRFKLNFCEKIIFKLL